MNEGEPTLALLLCRWVTPAVIPVSLPPDASAAERSLLGKALSAWEVALPVRFEQTSAVLARLEIRFARVGEGDPRRTSGLTAADCDLRESPPSVERAVVSLRRANLDVLDRPVALSDEELLGTALHELGHALGFQGHVAHGRSVMVRNTEAVRRMGRGVLAGEALRAPSVQALYRVPSGAIVGRIALASGPARRLVDLAEVASVRGWPGPWVRVGDRGGRIFWRSPRGGEAALQLLDWSAARRDPQGLVLLPNPSAWSALQGEPPG